MVLLETHIFCLIGTSLGGAKAFQEVEDKILTEAPSSTCVWCMSLPPSLTMIWKGMEEGRRGSGSLFQSKEKTSTLGGDSVETGEMPPDIEESDVTRRT